MPRVGATYTQHGQSQRGHAVQRLGVPRVVREPRDPKLARAAPENRRTKMTKPSLEVFVRVYLSQIVSDAENTFDRDRLKASMRMLDGLQLLLMQTELGRSRILIALRAALENLSHGHPDAFFETVPPARNTPPILMFQALASVAMQLRKIELETKNGKQTGAVQEAAHWVAKAINKECGRLRLCQRVTGKTVIEWRRGFTAPRTDKRSKRSDVTAAVIFDGYQTLQRRNVIRAGGQISP
jgi:hypothetical protein